MKVSIENEVCFDYLTSDTLGALLNSEFQFYIKNRHDVNFLTICPMNGAFDSLFCPWGGVGFCTSWLYQGRGFSCLQVAMSNTTESFPHASYLDLHFIRDEKDKVSVLLSNKVGDLKRLIKPSNVNNDESKLC